MHNIPIALPRHPVLPEEGALLAADVGGTKTDMALYVLRDGELLQVRKTVYPSREWPSIATIIRHFKGELPMPGRISIAFAGPIRDGRAKATNLDWEIDSRQLRLELGLSEVFLLNDLEAAAYGLAALTARDMIGLYPGTPPAEGNAAIIAPGTGLGEAGLFWDGHALRPFATEGGHTAFAPRNKMDWQLFVFLQKQFGHVSWERVISGPGIYQIFRFLREIEKREVPVWLADQIAGSDPAAAIDLGAERGVPICLETFDLFMRYLAIESANLVLKLKATGGLYIGGGIVPKIWTERVREVFLSHFFDVGRMRPLIEATPVQLITNPATALLGAAVYGAFRE